MAFGEQWSPPGGADLRPAHGWDPRTCGARCDVCPLGPNGFLRPKGAPWAPVPMERHDNAFGISVSQVPGPEETKHGYPFAGGSGTSWTAVLRELGWDRPHFEISNVLSCECPGEPSGAYERMENAVRNENKRLLKENPKAVQRGTPGAAPRDAVLWPHPADACRPRLLRDLGQHTRVFALGGTAAKAILHTEQGIFALQGGPRDQPFTPPDGGPERILQVMPTFHPAFINRARQWWRVWRADVAKALRWWRGQRTWKDPYVDWQPSIETLRNWLQAPAAWHCIDTETSSLYPEVAQLRCITITAPLDPPETRTCWVCSGRGRVDAAHMRHLRLDWMAAILDASKQALPASYVTTCESCEGRGSAVYDKRAVYIPVRGMDGVRRFYSDTEEYHLRQLIRMTLAGTNPLVSGASGAPVALGHNFVPYDLFMFFHWLREPGDNWALIESWLARCRDTIPLARFRGPEMAKALGVVGGELTDIHKWKQDNEGKKLASGARDDQQLGWYGTLDTAVNSDIVRPLVAEAASKGAFKECNPELRPKAWPAGLPFNLDEMDQVRTRMCLGLRYTGQAVDQQERIRWETELSKEEASWRAKAVSLAVELGGASPDFNPISRDQVCDLLYTKFKWTPIDFSELTGMPSTRDEVLREHIGDPTLPANEKLILKAIRKTRRSSKLRSTFCAPCRPMVDDPENGRVWTDGRVHAAWSAGVVAVARLACQDPNLTNVPAKLRSMYTAGKGNLLVGADWDQVHLRIIANRWRIGRLLECFHKGLDPHIMLAEDFFGDVFRNAPGWGPDGFSRTKKPKEKGSPADRMRNLAKTIRYQGAYWDIPEGIHKSVTKAEDENGDLVFADFDVREVRRLYEVWMKAEPEWESAWQWVLKLYETNALQHGGGIGFLEESILNRRSGALEFGKRQAVVNFDILAVEPALMSLAEREVIAAFPFEKWGPGTGMVNQCHDAITVEVPEHLARRPDKKTLSWAENALAEAMTIRVPGWEIPFTTEAKAAWRWNET